MPTSLQTRRDLRLCATLALAAAAALALLAYVFHRALPFNPLNLPRETEVAASMWSPQGWKFFTRNPREDWLIVYQNRGAAWARTQPEPNFTLSNWLGVGRGVRAEGIEIALLIYDLPRSAFRPCRGPAASCIAQAPIAARVKNKTPEPKLCGQVGVALQTQVPWAWSVRRDAVIMPSRVARLEVRC
jgi:antimicrobial peptide system SdpA family protein